MNKFNFMKVDFKEVFFFFIKFVGEADENVSCFVFELLVVVGESLIVVLINVLLIEYGYVLFCFCVIDMFL